MLWTTSANALELELGMGFSENPLYRKVDCDVLPDKCDANLIGKIALSHTFYFPEQENMGLKFWIDHYSLFRKSEVDPDSHGKNMAGASLVFKLF